MLLVRLWQWLSLREWIARMNLSDTRVAAGGIIATNGKAKLGREPQHTRRMSEISNTIAGFEMLGLEQVESKKNLCECMMHHFMRRKCVPHLQQHCCVSDRIEPGVTGT